MSQDDEPDLFGIPSDIWLVQSLLDDFQSDLQLRVARYGHLLDISRVLGESGTMFFGGTASFHAWSEARSAFVSGNFMATILLCQALAENVLAGLLHISLESLPPKITFGETLKRAEARGILQPSQIEDLKKLASLRNPLSHFRGVMDPQNLTRRSMHEDEPAEDLLERDAHFALGTVVTLLANPPFRVGLPSVGG